MSSTGFKNSTLQYTYTSLNYSTDNFVMPFTEHAGQDTNFVGFDGYNFGSVNVENDRIRFALDGIYTNVYFGPGHSLGISDVGVDDVPRIDGFTLSTNIAGITDTDITFTSQSISIDVANTSWVSGDYLEVFVMFAKKPLPPATIFTGTAGDDFLTGTAGRDLINARAGDDFVFAGNDNDTVKGGDGDDVIGGGKHADALYGEQGDDTIYAGDGDDSVYGGIGDDSMFGGTGHDSLFGGDGNDTVYGSAGNDLLKGADGNDLLGGGAGNDEIHGGADHDTAFGRAGNDKLFGDMGNDRLFGGDGRDQLTGGLGNDNMAGGTGSDTFMFGKNEGDDRITDFDGGKGDRIDLSGQTCTITENKAGFAVLELSGGGTILLDQIAIGDISADWFLVA